MRKITTLLLVVMLWATACSSADQQEASSPSGGDAATSALGDSETDQPDPDGSDGDPSEADGGTDTGSEDTPFRRGRLQAFDACDGYLDHMRSEAREHVTAYGLDGFGGGFVPEFRGDFETDEMSDEGDMAESAADGADSASAASSGSFEESGGGAPSYSETNNQVAGVDEPDIVKTDGNRLITLTDQTLQVFTLDGDTAVDAGTLTTEFYPTDILLADDSVLLLGTTWAGEFEAQGTDTSLSPNSPIAIVQRIDISGPPTVVSTLRVEGNLLSARRIDTTARIVISSPPPQLGFVYPNGPNGEEAAAEANRKIVEESTLEDWLADYEVVGADGTVTSGQAVECSNIYYPSEFSGFNLLSVLTVDITEELTPGNATAVVSDGQTVYASAESLYVTTTRWPAFDGGLVPEPAAEVATGDDAEADLAEGDAVDPAAPPTDDDFTTSIHRFDITDPSRAIYVASGDVEGHLLNQFSLDEYDNNLRVATTAGSPWGWGSEPNTESFITVLAPDGENLNEIGKVGGLGKGEQIYSVRFMGPDAYVVTFRQIDPFYVVDLSEPTAPAVVGELKIPGFSSYLHPVGENRILGVGQDATEEGRTTGAKASLFDVSDPANPRELAVWTNEGGSSAVEFDHRAFLWWEPTQQAVLPLVSWEQGTSGAVVLNITDDSITEQGLIDHAREEDPLDSPCSAIPRTGNEWFEPGMTVELCDDEQLDEATKRPGFWCEVFSSSEFDEYLGEELGIGDFDVPEGSSVVLCFNEDGGLPPMIRRSLVVDDTLWSVSDRSVQANDLATLDQLSRTDLTVDSREYLVDDDE